MPLTSRAETYFIVAMMILILIVCGASVYFFVKTYKKEMADKREREAAKQKSEEKNQ